MKGNCIKIQIPKNPKRFPWFPMDFGKQFLGNSRVAKTMEICPFLQPCLGNLAITLPHIQVICETNEGLRRNPETTWECRKLNHISKDIPSSFIFEKWIFDSWKVIIAWSFPIERCGNMERTRKNIKPSFFSLRR